MAKLVARGRAGARGRGGAKAAAIVPTMEQQHHAIEDAYTEVTGLLGGWRSTGRGGEALADAFERLTTVLVEHMGLEEKEILPLTEKHLTAKEWHQLGEHGKAVTPKKAVPLIFGMTMYEGDPEVIKALLATLPLPVRLLAPALGRRKYAAHAKRVHGTPRLLASAPETLAGRAGRWRGLQLTERGNTAEESTSAPTTQVRACR